MHQAPQFHEIILERSSSEQQSPLGIKIEQSLPPLGFPIFDHVGLIQNQIFPLLPPKHFGILCNTCHGLSLSHPRMRVHENIGRGKPKQ